jgi:circadian clock protein KaiB
MSESPEETLDRFEARLAADRDSVLALTLFVAGASDMSARAIANVRALCDTYLAGRHSLEVVDVHRDASLMSDHEVVAAPTLIKMSPLPKRMLVGDLSDTARVLRALDIDVEHSPPAKVVPT